MNAKRLSLAARLWTNNPEPHYHLSLLAFNSLDNADSGEATRQARMATQLGPLWPRYWAQLAWSCESAADTSCADEAVRNLIEVAPMDPDAISLAANYYVTSNRPALALDQFRRLLQIDPGATHDVVRICDAAGYPSAQLEQILLQAGPQVMAAYLTYLVGAGKPQSVQQTWNELVQKAEAGGFPLSATLVAPFVDRLVQAGNGAQLDQVRLDLEKLQASRSEPPGNVIFNPGFEQQPTGDGLDWRLNREERLPVVDFAAGKAHGGQRCLRVDFPVRSNKAYVLVSQFLPLQPNSRYHLSAWVRSEDITSDSGPRLQLVDMSCNDCLNVTTDSLVGTSPWHQITIDFSTGPHTSVGRLDVVRPKSRAVLGDISGTFWLDDVSLIRQAADSTVAHP
jgi:hypothetical protein